MRNYKKSLRLGFSLEEHVAEKLKVIDPNSRPAKNSGASGNVGDISNKYYAIECKQRNTENVIVNRKVWYKLLNELPIDSKKIPMLVLENKHKEKFVVLNFDTFVDEILNKE